MDDCGHRCCRIPENGYHVHPRSPEDCPHCQAGVAGTPAEAEIQADVDRMSNDLDRIATSVTDRIAPQIPGLPRGDGLEELVGSLTAVHYLDALDDHDLDGIDPDQWRTIVAARVALALAFREAGHPPGAAR
jgi:hypothetical protein